MPLLFCLIAPRIWQMQYLTSWGRFWAIKETWITVQTWAQIRRTKLEREQAAAYIYTNNVFWYVKQLEMIILNPWTRLNYVKTLSVHRRGIPGNGESQRKWKFLPITQHLLLVWCRTFELWMPAERWGWRRTVGWVPEAKTGRDGLGQATRVLSITPARCHFIQTS